MYYFLLNIMPCFQQCCMKMLANIFFLHCKIMCKYHIIFSKKLHDPMMTSHFFKQQQQIKYFRLIDKTQPSLTHSKLLM